MARRYFDEGLEDEEESSDWDKIKQQYKQDWKGDIDERLKKARRRSLIRVILLIIATILLCYFL